ncbi:MAG: hypothetical protein HQ515_12555 [Phycisphaeraceae bacterium]|nr:hypothetical protein [Phycisphaeraceae bacterium]
MIVGGKRYWFHGGIYYRSSGNGYVVVSAPLIPILPQYQRVVHIRGVAYYVSDGVYYKRVPEGYIVVEKPTATEVVTQETPSVQPDNTVTLYVPKRTEDGFVSVMLKKLESGYLGPQGEFYPTMPPVIQLTEMYGMADVIRNARTDVFFIHAPNKDGDSFTRVTLTRHNGGFRGPQGEFYPLMPSVIHLTELYGTSEEPILAKDTFLLQVRRENGEGFVEVELKKHELGYLGPQGELYPELPSADQLQEMYGDD